MGQNSNSEKQKKEEVEFLWPKYPLFVDSPKPVFPFSALRSDASATPLIPNLPLLSLPFFSYFRFSPLPRQFSSTSFQISLLSFFQFTKPLRSALNPRSTVSATLPTSLLCFSSSSGHGFTPFSGKVKTFR